MLRIIREGQRWLTALFVVGVGFVFIFFLGLGGPLTGPPPNSVATVGPFNYGQRELERARRERETELQSQLGSQYDARRFRDTLNELALRRLEDEGLLAVSAQELGMRVSNREIEQRVAMDGSFRNADGNFDVEAFRNFVDYEYGGERAFLLAQRPSELALKMRRLLLSHPHVSEGEVKQALQRELQEVRLAYVSIDSSPSETLEIDESLVAEAQESRAPEIQELYESQQDRFHSPERVHARHILIRLPADAEESSLDAARLRAQDLFARIEAGEDFETLAREHSEDTASSASGGDLGFFQRGQMVGEFETAAFDAQPGQLVGPVQTNFGFHLIRVEDHQEETTRSFDEASAELTLELLREESAEREARAIADALAEDIRAGQSLEEAASARELEVGQSELLKRRPDGFVPGLGASPELLAAAFALEPGSTSPRVFELRDQLVLVASQERVEADPETVAVRSEETQQKLRIERINSRAGTWLDARRDALLDAGMLEVDLAAVRR